MTNPRTGHHMKRIISGIAILAGINASFGQGSVGVANTPTTLFRTNLVGTTGSALSTMGPWYYEVLTAPSTVTSVDASLQQLLSAPWSDTGVTASNTGIAGRMAAAGGLGSVVNFWPAGQTNAFIIVGWNAAVGASWAAAASRLQGENFSGVGGGWSGGGLDFGMYLGATTVGFRQAGGVVGGNTIPTASLFGTAPDPQGRPITTPTDMFTFIPEPSSCALAGLGITALAIFRRKARS